MRRTAEATPGGVHVSILKLIRDRDQPVGEAAVAEAVESVPAQGCRRRAAFGPGATSGDARVRSHDRGGRWHRRAGRGLATREDDRSGPGRPCPSGVRADRSESPRAGRPARRACARRAAGTCVRFWQGRTIQRRRSCSPLKASPSSKHAPRRPNAWRRGRDRSAREASRRLADTVGCGRSDPLVGPSCPLAVRRVPMHGAVVWR